jgi:heavy metal translocating P-type ATPase
MALLFDVTDMNCADCASRLEDSLSGDADVSHASVLLMSGLAQVTLRAGADPVAVAPRLAALGRSLGFGMTAKATGSQLTLDFSCGGGCGSGGAHSGAAEAEGLLPAARSLPGVTAARASGCAGGDGHTTSLHLLYEPYAVGARHLRGALAGVSGKAAAPPCEHHGHSGGGGVPRWARAGGALGLALGAALASYAAPHGTGGYDDPFSAALSGRVFVAWALATLAVILYFPPLFRAAWGAAVVSRTMTMDTLVCLSAGVAYLFALGLLLAAWGGAQTEGFGEPPFEATAVLLPLVALAREVDHGVRALTQRAMVALAKLQAVDAVLARGAPCAAGGGADDCGQCVAGGGGAGAALAPSLIHLGDVLAVRAGQLFPTDGTVVAGATSANEALVTGEARPVEKGLGDAVIGGTLNGEGDVQVRCGALPSGGTVSKILALLAGAAASRPKLQTTANAVAAAFTPFVVAASLATLAGWWAAAATGQVDTQGVAPLPFALQFTLSLLVVSCPCVVALAVAPVMAAAATVAAAQGLLVKSGLCLEATAAATHVVFDKTGTLTRGAAAVVALEPSEDAGALMEACASAGFPSLPRGERGGGLDAAAVQLLAAAAVAARGSLHPLAAAVAAHATAKRVPAPPPPRSCAEEVARTTHAGKGVLVAARENGEGALALGSPEWLEGELGVGGAVKAAAAAREAGLSVVALAVGSALAGVIGLHDELRGGAAAALRALESGGVTCWVASGDSPGAVANAAAALSVPPERALGALSPTGKVALVQSLQRDGARVLFVGDGVNDAAAMAAADVGVAMGAGAAVSMEAADVVVKESNLWAVVALRSLALRARVQIRANFVWAGLYNAVTMPIAAGVLYPALKVVAIPPGFAGLSELLSSVPVVLGSLALFWWSPPKPPPAEPPARRGDAAVALEVRAPR